ncbi:MAG: aminoacyl-tRNA hydrolase [Nitrospinaceae bacterium]|nr:MAG: aminoacyl-tRNA hydrolase [Nitrospinaceae bacterium]
MFLLLGLGNPGPRYELTRHNVGFLVLDNLSEKHRIKLDQHRYQSNYGLGEVDGLKVVAAKPLAYMNRSGPPVRSILAALDIPPENIIVIHDDIDLPLGKIKKKNKGGDSGQRGVRSLIQTLGTDRFSRVRVGVGRPEEREDIVDYVLSPFEDAEMDALSEVIDQAVRMVEATLKELNNPINKTEDQTGC